MGNKLAYAEVNTILNYMDEKYIVKIPQKLREFFYQNSLDNNVIFNPKIPLENQNLQKETFSILAMLNLNYWCESEEHKQELIKKYKQQDIIKEEKLREMYNPDNIFNDKKSSDEVIENNQSVAIVTYNNHWYSKISNFFSILLRKFKNNS